MKWMALLLAGLLLAGCGGSGDGGLPPDTGPQEPPEDPRVCSTDGQRLSVRGFMEDHYFWYAQRGTPDRKAATMDAYFRSMLYLPDDRYSYSESTAAFDQLYNQGIRTGYGYALVWDDTARTRLRVRNVEPLSPVAKAGLRRGDEVLDIDGFNAQQVAAGSLPLVTQTGVVRSFRVRGTDGAQRSLQASSDDYLLSPVAATATFTVNRSAEQGGGSVKVGYLAYQQFVRYSLPDLGRVVRQFTAAGISELVLDLRYNGGGEVEVARQLSSLVGGDTVQGKLFALLRFNDKQASFNQRLEFGGTLPATPLAGLSRVVVLTSGGTASASELLINGLKPFIPVALVGDTTYGKPYGFTPRDWCGTNYNAVTFESVNALGVGGYTSGLQADCPGKDDLDRQLGDPAEARTRAALDYIAQGRCSALAPQSAAAATRPQVFGEPLPSSMFAR